MGGRRPSTLRPEYRKEHDVEHVAHIEVSREPIPGEFRPEDVGLSEMLVLFKEDIERKVPVHIKHDGVIRSVEFEVHVIDPKREHVAVFERMSAFAVRLAFEEFASVV